MSDLVTIKTRPDLKWDKSPKGFWVIDELIRSDAFRSLTKLETDILLYSMSERRYPSSRKRTKRNYWQPLNGQEFKLPYVSICKFFSSSGHPPPSIATITRAIKKFMAVGFLSQVEPGGMGQGNMSIYKIEHNWRVWKNGDSACFKPKKQKRGKGFCQPGSGKFFVKKSR